MERVFISERSTSGRPVAAMAGAGATARVRAQLSAAPPLAERAASRVPPPRRGRPPLPSRRKHARV